MSERRAPEQRAREWLAKQGYRLEYETAAALRRGGWAATQGRTYRDAEGGKTREIDIVAWPPLRLYRLPPATSAVVFECKVSGDPWIVRKAELDDDQRRWRPIASMQLSTYLAGQESPVPRWIRLDNLTALSLVVGAPAKEEQAYAAMSQLVSAAIGWRVREEADAERAVWVHPILMLEAPLFSLHYEEDGKEVLEPTTHERLLWSGYHGLSDPVLIDVWTPVYLAEGMEHLATSLSAISERIPNRNWMPPISTGF